jgi:hypothetical protein
VAQHDYFLDDSSGALFRADLNNALQAIITNNSGASAPSTTQAYQFWADTSAKVLKQRNSTNTAWLNILSLDTGTPVNAATAGNNSNITQLSGLTTPLSIVQGGTGNTTGVVASAVNAVNATNATNATQITGTATNVGYYRSGETLRYGGPGGPTVTGQGGGAAGITFHRPNVFAVNLGLDTLDNSIRVGGWSLGGVSYPLLYSTSTNAPGNAPTYACRAWARAAAAGTNGTNCSLSGAGNVAYITREASGRYLVVFETPMPDANYSVVGSAKGTTATSASDGHTVGIFDITSSAFRVNFSDPTNNSASNPAIFSLTVFR